MPDKFLGPSFKFHFEGNAISDNVVEGSTFYSNTEELKHGNMPNMNVIGSHGIVGLNSEYPDAPYVHSLYNGITTHILDGSNTTCLAFMVPEGYYNGVSYVGRPELDIANMYGLSAGMLVSGQSCLGITGTGGRVYRESGWVTQVQDDPNLKGRPFKVRVQTNGNDSPSITLAFNNGTNISV